MSETTQTRDDRTDSYRLADARQCESLHEKKHAQEALSEGDHLRLTVTWLTDSGTPEATFDADVTTVADDRVRLETPKSGDRSPPVQGDWYLRNTASARVTGVNILYAIKQLYVWPADSEEADETTV